MANKQPQEYDMPRGYPRPRSADGTNRPVPYVAQDPKNLATLHKERDPECTILKLCQMCGEGFTGDPNEKVSIARNSKGEVEHDHGLTHLKCAKIVEKFCPAFNDPNYWTQLHMETTTHLSASAEIETMMKKFPYFEELKEKYTA